MNPALGLLETTGLTPAMVANSTAPQTRSRELAMSKTNPISKFKTDFWIVPACTCRSATTFCKSSSCGPLTAIQTVHEMARMNKIIRSIPSMREISPSINRRKSASVTPLSKGNSRRKILECT